MNDQFTPRARLDFSVEDARARVVSLVGTLAPRPHSLTEALGTVLGEDILAPIDLPSYANSAMDGYALRSAETANARTGEPARFAVIDWIAAGQRPSQVIGRFEAMRIDTGAPVPDSCDAVVPVELVESQAERISIDFEVKPGLNVRPKGEDIQAGSIAFTAGTKLRAQEVALLAALGIESVVSHPFPRVAIVTLGHEFDPAAHSPIHDANGPMLGALVTMEGGHTIQVAVSTGEIGELAALFASLEEDADLIVTSGGISDSHADTMAELLQLWPSGELWNVRLRPGKHFGAGRFETCPILSLPGNPVAAFVGFELFGRVALDSLAGRDFEASRQVARASGSISGRSGRVDALRGRAWADSDGQTWVAPTENRGSGVISSLAAANCLLLLPEDVEQIDEGTTVEIQWITDYLQPRHGSGFDRQEA